MQFPRFRFAQPSRTAFDDTGDDTADGITLLFYLCNECFHLLGFPGVGAADGVRFDAAEVVPAAVSVELYVADL